MTMLQRIKTALRISAVDYDEEVTGLIAAAREHLRTSGVSEAVLASEDPAPLVEQAITIYCKSNFGFDNPDADRLDKSFKSISDKLLFSSEFRSES